MSSPSNKSPTGNSDGPWKAVDKQTKLTVFQELIGLQNRQPGSSTPPRPAGEEGLHNHGVTIWDLLSRGRKGHQKGNEHDSRGLYQRAVKAHAHAKHSFRIASWCINTLYILQIFVAATFTGLSAYQGHRSALTILGAINTIIAGLLALLKGQGLPNRYRKARDQYQDVITSIINTEREFSGLAMAASLDTALVKNPQAEALRLERLYQTASKNEQDNYPEVYVSDHERAMMAAENEKFREGMLNQTPEEFAKRVSDLVKWVGGQSSLPSHG